MKKLKKSRVIVDIILLVIILLMAMSNIFSNKLEILLKLKPDIPSTTNTQIHFIDVGQGDAIAINFSNGKTMLVDSGTEDYREKLINYLDNVVLKEHRKIDYLVLTHPDSDHSSNMSYIVNHYEIGTFYRPMIYEEYENKDPSVYNLNYRELLQSIENKNINTVFNSDDILLVDNNIKIDWIMPQDLSLIDNTNDYSPAIIIEDNGIRTFLAGDIGEDIEKELLFEHESGNINLDVDILKLSHHGSKYSNSYDFIKTLSPSYVVACVGENTYGHPSNDVIERILQYDEEFNCNLYSNLLTTKDHGNIIYTLNTNIHVTTISNIDDYVFVSYWVYTIIAIVFLGVVILIPHAKIWYQNIRFKVRNKKHREHVENSKNESQSD